LDAVLSGYVQRRKIEHEQALALAWHVEAFARVKRLPSLAKVLGRHEGRVPVQQSNEEILAAMRVWAAMSRQATSAAESSQEVR
jgi:hypothetical protein